MDSGGQCSFTQHCSGFMHHIHIFYPAQKHPFLNTKTEWHYLLAVVICFFSFQASTALTAQSTPTLHKHTHTYTHYLLFHTSKCEALPGLSTIASMALLFFFVSRQPQPVLTAQLLIFIFPQNFNHFVLYLSCLSIVSMPITTCSCVVLHCGSQIFLFSDTRVPLCMLGALACCVRQANRTIPRVP